MKATLAAVIRATTPNIFMYQPKISGQRTIILKKPFLCNFSMPETTRATSIADATMVPVTLSPLLYPPRAIAEEENTKRNDGTIQAL